MRQPDYRMVRANEWRPQKGRQTAVLQRMERELLVGGARFSTKTETGLAWGCEERYIMNPRFSGLVIRQNYEDLSHWIQRARIFYDGIGKIQGNPSEIRWIGGGVTRLGHWKDMQTIGRYIGQEYQKLNIEELNLTIGSKEEYIQISSCCRSTVIDPETNKPLPAQLYASTNPGGKGHRWVKDYFVKPATLKTYIDPQNGYSRIFIPMTVEDNPLGIERDPEYYNWLKNLPEPLNSMWYKGSWDIVLGQHFPEFNESLGIEPYHIGSRAHGHIFGSIDIGVGTNTSFGLWYKGDDGHIERLCSYLANGMTHEYHARQIFQKIERMGEYIDGAFPVTIWLSHDAMRKERLNERQPYRGPIDEYKDVFKELGKETRFVAINPVKSHGCNLMHQVFDQSKGVAILSYWKGFNESFEIAIQSAMTDPNDAEVYLKVKKFNPELRPFTKNLNVNDLSMTGDVCDETMYGVCGMCADMAAEKDRNARKVPTRMTEFKPHEILQHTYGECFRSTSLA